MTSQQQQEDMSPFPSRIIHFGTFNVTFQVHHAHTSVDHGS